MRTAEIKHILFLFNHDAEHQVAHMAGTAAAFASRYPNAKTSIAYSTQEIYEAIHGHFTREAAKKVNWVHLKVPNFLSQIAARLDRLFPSSRLLRLKLHKKLFASTDMIVSTERTCLRLKKSLPANSMPLFTRIPHGTGDRSVTFHPDHRQFDMTLVAGQKMADQLAANGVDANKINIVGYPKFEKIDFSKKPKIFDNEKPVFVYNPHFDPQLSSWYQVGPDIMRWFASEAGQSYNLIFAPHVMLFRKKLHISPEYKVGRPRPDIPAEAQAAQNIHIDVDSPKLFDMSYMLAANAYIGDASSQIYEFIMRPRPVFILDPDANLAAQGNMTLPFLQLGPVIPTVEEFARQCENLSLLSENYEAKQRELVNYTFSIQDQKTTQRAADAIAARVTLVHLHEPETRIKENML
jgi:CDP-glycerol glycerophosphotransferase (TagB/SpsB family)